MKEKENNLIEKFFAFFRPIWMWIREKSPKGAYLKLGDYWIKDPSVPKIDRLFSRTRRKTNKPDYESNTISAIKKYVRQGDKVTVVGGGYGITAIAAIEQGGVVTVIEASKDRVQTISEIWKQYNLKGSIIHGYVGSPISLWGELDGANKIDQLPDCDILELDCEGAEREILSNLNVSPRVIIVESHGHLGSPSKLIKDQLQNLGYNITSKMIENLENDVIVFVGEKNKV